MARRRGMPAAKMNSYLPRSRFGGRGLFVFNRGPVAQRGARFHGMEEVVGSIPTAPTNHLPDGWALNKNARGQEGADWVDCASRKFGAPKGRSYSSKRTAKVDGL